MKVFRSYLLILTGFTLLLFSCKKDDDSSDPIPPSRTEILISRNWKATAITVNPARSYIWWASPGTDWYAQLEDCRKDNIKKYNTDKTMIFDEGAAKCNPADVQTISGTWVFNTDETIITETNASSSSAISYKILELSMETLKVEYVENFWWTNYTFTVTYKPDIK